MELLILFWLVANPLIGLLIGQRRGQPVGGCLLGLLLGPIGWLISLASSDARRGPCRACAESIMLEAKVCPHCRTEDPHVRPTLALEVEADEAYARMGRTTERAIVWMLLAALFVGLLVWLVQQPGPS